MAEQLSLNNRGIENRLWDAADELRANSKLKSSEYAVPVLGLIFLRFADHKFAAAEAELMAKVSERRMVSKTDYQAKGVMYVPKEARWSAILNLPEGSDIGSALNEAMRAIERDNEELRDVLPRVYNQFDNAILTQLLRIFNSIPMNIEGDAFGGIYEYFLGEFAMKEGQRGGEFFTPTSIVKLIVEVISPFHGRIYDPACGSGGMFVQSARFVREHQRSPSSEISIFGQERVAETVRLCEMNLAVHGLSGDIRQGNSYYEDLHDSVGKFDFVMANPPFNVDRVDRDRIKGDQRFGLGIPKVDNANYLWIQIFDSVLNATGRAGFIMAHSATEARGSEMEIRRRLIEKRHVDVVMAVGPNFFYTVTLPCTLWFLDKDKAKGSREDTILFVDARHIYHRIDRAHRDFTSEQIEFLSNIVRLYRGDSISEAHGSSEMMRETFPQGHYADVLGLCKKATVEEVGIQNWSLNPGRYVGIAPGQKVSDEDFTEKVQTLNEKLQTLNLRARELEQEIASNITDLIEP